MPAFDGTASRKTGNVIGDIFTEMLKFGSGDMSNPTELPFTAAAEPATTVEDCNAWRTSLWTNLTGNAGIGAAGYPAGEEPCSGNQDFLINLRTETQGIYADPNSGIRDLY